MSVNAIIDGVIKFDLNHFTNISFKQVVLVIESLRRCNELYFEYLLFLSLCGTILLKINIFYVEIINFLPEKLTNHLSVAISIYHWDLQHFYSQMQYYWFFVLEMKPKSINSTSAMNDSNYVILFYSKRALLFNKM